MATTSHAALLDPSSYQGQEHQSAESTEKPSILPNATEPLEKTRKRDLLLASALLFIPLLAIALLCLAFVFVGSKRVRFQFNETNELPILAKDIITSNSSYYTLEDIGSFTLLGSWASSAAQLVLAPFMVLFSFLIAREIKSSRTDDIETKEVASTLNKLVGGEWIGVWHWISYVIHSTRTGERKKQYKSRAVHVAGMGLLLAGLLSLLIVAGDTWLHLAVQPIYQNMYENITYPQNKVRPSSDDVLYAAGWTTIPGCDETLKPAINISDPPLPCSLTNIGGAYNVASPGKAYFTLAKGLNANLSDFNVLLDNASEKAKNQGLDTQIVTYVDGNTNISHSFLFFPDAAYEFNPDPENLKNTSFGIDYVAHTTSLATKCKSVTKSCFSQNIPANQTILTIPFNCSADFFGDVGQPPTDGLERIQGWDSGFYQKIQGINSTIPLQEQLNPFTFFAVAAVDSLSFADLEASNDSQATDGSIIDARSGRVAFALSCEATVYDVTYSLIDSDIYNFSATPSSASKASIIKAPLQVGFGRYNLYQSAQVAVLRNLTDLTVPDYMSNAFSQIGMALVSGVFKSELNIQQRFRYALAVTEVPEAPLWFLVTACLIYTIISVIALMAALILRRDAEIARKHAGLLPRYPFRMRTLLSNLLKEPFGLGRRSGKKKERARREENDDSRDDGRLSGDWTS